jgi:ABC-type Fe3+/spermidine/putrescine transport system ATPase subunit
MIAVRPEWHDLFLPGQAPPAENALAGTITEIVFLGETLHVVVDIGGGTPVRVALRNEGILQNPLQWQVGQAVEVAWLPQDAQVLAL